MLPLIIVDNPRSWPLKNPGALVVAARSYLTDPHYSELRRAHVFNLCRSYRYQSLGYYVSLLAMARGHNPLPSITTIQDMKSVAILRMASEELTTLLNRSLRPLQSNTFTLSVYFGRNLARRYDALSAHLFRLYRAPLLRAESVRDEEGWRLRTIRPIAANDIPPSHHDFVFHAAREYFAHDRRRSRTRVPTAYDLAILRDPREELPPSNERALKRFVQAARKLHIGAELIERDDISRLAEFDALFIRVTTAVNHYTYRFARRALAEGLVVIDDPESIVKCANKVYLAELLDHHHLRHPRTVIVHRDNVDTIIPQVGLPCVLKQPDSAFSAGVRKADTESELQDAVAQLLDASDLVVAQHFLPTPFDWRIVVLDRLPLLACRYYMARRHWQIVKHGVDGRRDDGRVEAVALDAVPERVVKTGVRAARLIGDGLYGVDLKEVNGRVYVIEINDNPNLDGGFEDQILGDELYTRVMQVFLNQILARKRLAERSRDEHTVSPV